MSFAMHARAATPPRAPSPDHAVGTYVSSEWGFSTSSYWIEGPTGVIVIDTEFLTSAAEHLLKRAEAATHKPVVLAIVLHANPDKFNGAAVFQKHGVRVVSSQEVVDLIPNIHENRKRSFYARYKPDYPSDAPKVEAFGSQSTDLTAGGVTVHAHVMGAGCSEAHVVVEWKGHVFPGDLIANKNHSWLEIGRTDEWLQRLDEIDAMHPKYVHPGRGPSGGAELVDHERAYLKSVIATVAAEHPTKPITGAELDRVKSKIEAANPNDGFAIFLNIGLPAEWDRQAKENGAPR